MKDEKMTPVTKQSWTNPSIGSTNNSSLNEIITENKKEIDELKNEVQFLKNELSKVTGNEVDIPKEEVSIPITEEPKADIDLPFVSPFTEATDIPSVEAVQDILESVKEEVKEEPKVEDEEKTIPAFDDMLMEKDKVSVVVNRYNTDLEASTKGKGAKYISLNEAEHNKLLSGKINE